jgi:SAM-dependent MidA family methyltransferase
MYDQEAGSVSVALADRIAEAIGTAGGWCSFERYMAMALYEPGLGYYARDDRQFGLMPASGSDFVTAPELSPLFGQALARQIAQALAAGAGDEVWEFGAGSGALAQQLIGTLDELGQPLRRYHIVDLSGSLRARQQARLSALGDRVRWHDRLPEAITGVVVGNEVLDAMPVTLLHFDGAAWTERGVAVAGGRLVFADRPTGLRPPVDLPWPPGSTLELHRQSIAFIRSLAERLRRGAAFFIDYGFPSHEYYHPQRHAGTLLCHRAHRVDADPLQDPGDKDITSHVDFTGIALAAQDAGLDVLGYTSQAHFLFNCGLAELMAGADLAVRSHALKLVNEHEMGELFKVIGLARGCDPVLAADAIGFRQGDRSHRL